MEHALERAVARAIVAGGPWAPGATVVAAVSGGADSLALLGALHALRARGEAAAPGEIVVAHLDHGLRGGEAAADARYVTVIAEELGLRCVVERVDVAALARAEHRSLEDAARQARYRFLRRVAAEVGGERICTGHTRDDQVETIVFHFLRGSGLAGLAGMAPLTGDLARPLLAVTRAETEAYCAARGWLPRVDATNGDLRFARNRIRHELLPLLETYNPNLRTLLIRNGALLAADEAYLEAQAEAAWAAVARVEDAGDGPGAVALPLAELCALPLAIRHRLYRRAARLVSSGLDNGLEARHIALLDALVATERAGQARMLPGGLRAERTYDALTLRRGDAFPTTTGGEVPTRMLSVPGVVEMPELGWRVRAWLAEGPAGLDTSDAPAPENWPTFAHAGDEGNLGHAMMRVYVAPEVAGTALTVRAWRPGDRFRPMGMAHEKKLQDYFSDAKVPRARRARLPLIFGPDHLLWVAGLRIDDRVRLPPGASRALILQLEPLDSSTDEASVQTHTTREDKHGRE